MTDSIACNVPGLCYTVYNATKACINLLASAVRDELSRTGVSVTCAIPGLTDTEAFRRAALTKTALGQSPKDDPDVEACAGYAALTSARPKDGA